MPDFNVHGLDPSWVEPGKERVQEFFDTLSEKYVRDKPRLIRDTTKEELDYIAARAAEAEIAKEADSIAAWRMRPRRPQRRRSSPSGRSPLGRPTAPALGSFL